MQNATATAKANTGVLRCAQNDDKNNSNGNDDSNDNSNDDSNGNDNDDSNDNSKGEQQSPTG
jgi:hypothetical protein